MEINKKLRYVVAILLFITILAFFLPYIRIAPLGIDIESVSLIDIFVASVESPEENEPDLPFLTYLPFLLGIMIILTLAAAFILIAGKRKSHFWLGIAAGAVLLISHLVALGYKSKYSLAFNLAGFSVGLGFYISICLGAIALIGSIVGLTLPAEPSMYMARKANKQGLLIGRSGMYANEAIDIPAGEEIILGRDSALAHIVLDKNSEKVSRKHCGIFYDDVNNNYAVIDYSTNGTFVEGGNRLVANIATTLPSGTVILLGNKENSFMLK